MSLSREEIIRMAYAAGLFNDDQSPLPEFLEHFANAAYDAGAAAEREKHNGPCALQHNTNWKKGAGGHTYLASNFSCSACGHVGLHDAMPMCRRAILARGGK